MVRRMGASRSKARLPEAREGMRRTGIRAGFLRLAARLLLWGLADTKRRRSPRRQPDRIERRGGWEIEHYDRPL